MTYEAMGDIPEAVENYRMAAKLLEAVGAKTEVQAINEKISELKAKEKSADE